MRGNIKITLFNIAVIAMFFMSLFTFLMVANMAYHQNDAKNERVIERVKEIVVTPSPTPTASASATPEATTKNSRVKVTPTPTESATPTPSD